VVVAVTDVPSKSALKTRARLVNVAVGLVVISPYAQAEQDAITLQKMTYSESQERIEVEYSAATVSYSIGTDFTLRFNATEDVISGATPIWDLTSEASSNKSPDADSGYISDPQDSIKAFTYQLEEMADERSAWNTSLTWRTPVARDEISLGVSSSKEEDYTSKGVSLEYLHHLDASKNRSLSLGLSQLKNEAEFRRLGEWKDAEYTTLQIGLSQVFTPKLLAKAAFFMMREDGALTNPYQTVVRKVNLGEPGSPDFYYFLAQEQRPDSRAIEGMDVRAAWRIKLLGEPLTLHGNWRGYRDDWGVIANTLEQKTYLGDSSGWGQVSLGLRYSNQTAAVFFKSNRAQDNYFDVAGPASADERLGDLTTRTYSAGYEKHLFKQWRLHAVAARQKQNNGLSIDWAFGGISYEF
jgi:hypothetical protein